jgi:hypothetical protein
MTEGLHEPAAQHDLTPALLAVWAYGWAYGCAARRGLAVLAPVPASLLIPR